MAGSAVFTTVTSISSMKTPMQTAIRVHHFRSTGLGLLFHRDVQAIAADGHQHGIAASRAEADAADPAVGRETPRRGFGSTVSLVIAPCAPSAWRWARAGARSGDPARGTCAVPACGSRSTRLELAELARAAADELELAVDVPERLAQQLAAAHRDRRPRGAAARAPARASSAVSSVLSSSSDTPSSSFRRITSRSRSTSAGVVEAVPRRPARRASGSRPISS